jgi:Protein of unknown function (DUF3071)
MLTLTVIGVEDGALIAANDSGERFRIPIDAQLRMKLREAPSGSDAPKLSPREIQAHVRSGLTAAQVSTLTGAPISFIERFVGPVLAEREYMLDAARGVRVQTDDGGTRLRTFGTVMTERLSALAAGGTQWSSWKDPNGGWIVALSFSADDIEHEARWQFDPKRLSLAPDNVEAATLSQHGDLTAALTPRLRAVADAAPAAPEPSPDPDDPEPAAEPEGDVISVSHEHSSVMERVDPSASAPPTNVIGGRFGAPRDSEPVADEPEPADDATESKPKPEPAAKQTRFDSAAFDLARGLLEAERDEAKRAEAEQATTPPTRFELAGGTDRADKEPSTMTGVLTSLAARRGERPPADPNETAAMPADFDGDFDNYDFGDEDVLDDEDEDPFLPKEAPERDVPAHISRGRFPDALPEPAPKEALPPLKRPRNRGLRGAQRDAANAERTDTPVVAPDAQKPTASTEDQQQAETAPPAPRPVAVPPPAPEPAPTTRPRRGRTTMPSWDEIVYGRDD